MERERERSRRKVGDMSKRKREKRRGVDKAGEENKKETH